VRLESKAPFQLFELGALHRLPTEYVLFDYGKIRNIGWISSRQLNSTVMAIRVLASTDKQHWHLVTSLNPKAIPFLYQPLKKNIQARYLKIVFTLPLRNYQKAVLWEFDAYNQYGPYGRPPVARPSENTFSQAFGINTFWGWGYSVYSDRLKPGTGPQKFIAVAKNLRSYEPLNWDMLRPQQIPDFAKMAAGGGTPAKKWLNWDREYGTWKKDGFHIDITLQFKQENFPDTLWTNPYREAFAFGKAYAVHFCRKEHLVNMIEIGNEPWDYNATTYRDILSGMSAGIQSVSKIPVLPCAVQAYDPHNDNNNYIARYLNTSSAKNVTGLNTKPVYVTEFGFDSNGADENCTHSECVSEKTQAVYGVRMAMILWRLGARQFYWYYFANIPYKSFLHNRSGLCGSYKTGFREKLSFKTFAFLQQAIGHFHFEKVISENKNVYAYLLKDYLTGKEIVIAWRPIPSQTFRKQLETISLPGNVLKIISVLSRQNIPFSETNSKLQVNLSGVPLLIYLK